MDTNTTMHGRHQGCEVPFFEDVVGFEPYPWQRRCYAAMLEGHLPATLALPTGTGKTSAVLLYLIALAHGAALPRRLAYIVDRRSIVDQTTAAIDGWVDRIARTPTLRRGLDALAAFASERPIQVGTLRGGLADSGEWRLDPARPTVVVGTVDMIGSRLLFSGYGDGRNRRSLHAGLLGMDTCIILDEAHLSPALAETTRTLAAMSRPLSGYRLRTLTMSATPDSAASATLDDDDYAHQALSARLTAAKHPLLHPIEQASDRVAAMADLLCGYTSGAILAFLSSAQQAQQLHAEMVKRLGAERASTVGILTGTLRGHERTQLTQSPLWQRFAAPADADAPPAFLIATAAGEVGVDLDADHLVMDLPAADALIQRLGRVNRSGRRAHSDVHIVYAPEDIAYKDDDKRWAARLARVRAGTLALLQAADDLAPVRLLEWPGERRLAAHSPQPRLVPLLPERAQLLAATSVRFDKPPVAPFLRGVDDQPDIAETQLCWRSDTALLTQAGAQACEDALAMLPPRPRELVKAPAFVVAKTLVALVRKAGPFNAILQSATGGIEVRPLAEAEPRAIEREIRYATVVLPSEVGGLDAAGYLEPRRAGTTVEDLADDEAGVRFVLDENGAPEAPEWAARAIQWRLALFDRDDEDSTPRWWVYARRRADALALDADSDLSRLARTAPTLAEHNRAVGTAARAIGQALALPAWIVDALADAGARHDAGKARRVWQRAAGNHRPEPIAKSARGVFQPALLGGYRHEFGSLADAERSLPPVDDAEAHLQRELTLHLIAAHHGHARPGFGDPRQWDPTLPSDVAAAIAQQVERRYAELQARFGPWGLAWLEALLKCADARVSSGLSDGGSHD